MSTVVTGQDEDEILKAIQSMSRSGKVDGSSFFILERTIRLLIISSSDGFFIILIGKATQYTNQTLYIDNDNLLAGEDATEYLYQLGHRKIAYLGSDSSLTLPRQKNRLPDGIDETRNPFPSGILCGSSECIRR